MKFKLCNRVKVVTSHIVTGIYTQMVMYQQSLWNPSETVFINLANLTTLTGRPRKKFVELTLLIDLLKTTGLEYIAIKLEPNRLLVSIYCTIDCSLDLTKLASPCVTYLGICNDIDLTPQLG